MSANYRNHLVSSATFALVGATTPVFLPALPPTPLLAGIACLVGCLAATRPTRQHWLTPLFFMLVAFAWVCWHASGVLRDILPTQLEKQAVRIEGKIVDLPRVDDGKVRLLVKVESANPMWSDSGVGKVILSCYRCKLNFRAGERWRLMVKLKRPAGTASPGAFDYEKWLFRHRIVASGYIVEGGDNLRIESSRALEHQTWRTDLQTYIHSLPGLSTRSKGLFRALLIGDRDGLTDRDWHVLRSTGVSHLVAISGLHIGLIMVTVLFLLRHCLDLVPGLYLIFPRAWVCRSAGVVAATGYAALAGFAVPTLRALLMIGLFFLARLIGRDISLFHLLFATVALLLVFDPFIAFDTSFWLSFGAVFVIAWQARGLGTISWLLVQPRLWLGMMPLLILFFSQVSLVAPLANFIAIPVVSFLLLPAGLLASLAAGIGLDIPAELVFRWCATVVDLGWRGLDLLADLSMASLDYTLTGQTAVILLLATGLLVTTPFQLVNPAIYLCLVLLALIPAAVRLEPGDYDVTILDVGQGLSMVIRTMKTTTVYDTGPRYGPGFDAGAAVVLPYLDSMHLPTIDLLIVSHGDNDHIGGANSVIAGRPVDRILTSVPERLAGSEACYRGMEWEFDSVLFEVLGPDQDTPSGSNNRSCVVRISGTGGSVLLSGDIEREVERDLVTRFPQSLSADVLLVPHQGSRTSSRPVFLDRVSPELALVASGYLNSYGHPHPEVMARYKEREIPVLNTATSGTITVSIRKDGIAWSEYRQARRKFWFR